MLAVNGDPVLRVCAFAAVFALPGGAALAAVFDVSLPPGIAFRRQNSPTVNNYLLEALGGGVAVLDHNNDGLPDVFLSTAANSPRTKRFRQ